MTVGFGWGMFLFGTTVTIIGFSIAGLVIAWNEKKKRREQEEKERREKGPYIP
tara:strand:- start:6819 stop:6977 length:159 start_codon:yes stop_codon:yes gene_type:complete